MSSITITCPECQAEFDAAEQLDKHFQEFKLKEKELEQQKSEILQLQKDKSSNQEEIQELMKKLKNSAVLVKKDMESEIEASNKEAFQRGFDSVQLNIKVLKKEAKEAAKEEIEADIKKASDKAYQNGMLAAEQTLGDKQEIEVTKLKTQLAAERIDKERMRKHIEDLSDKSNQRNNELQGEAQEVMLEDMLKEKFPNDEVSDIKRGASGHDCTLIINNRNMEGLAKIAFESKNTKHFSEEWVEKLHKTLMEKKIPYGVIASKALPKDFKHIEWRYESIVIIPFKESAVVATGQMLRALCIREYEIRKVSMLDDSEKGQLYKRVLSPEMKMQVTSLMRSYLSTQDIIDDDERISAKSIVKRQANLNEQKTKLLKIFGAISGADTKLAENLIFTDDEVRQLGKIGRIKSIKGNSF
jgi:hypothetical protein